MLNKVEPRFGSELKAVLAHPETPRDLDQQALDLFETVEGPRTTVQTPFSWDGDAWRTEYMEIREEDREMLLKKGEENRRQRAEKRTREA